MQNNYTGLVEVNPFPLFCCHFLVSPISLSLFNYSVIHQVAQHTHKNRNRFYSPNFVHYFFFSTNSVCNESKSNTPARFHRANNKNILLWRFSNKNNCRRINILVRRSKPVSVSLPLSLSVCVLFDVPQFFFLLSSPYCHPSLCQWMSKWEVQHFIADQSGSVMKRDEMTIDGASGGGRCLVLNLKKKRRIFVMFLSWLDKRSHTE